MLTHITVLYIKKKISTSVEFEALTAVTMKISVLLDDIMYFDRLVAVFSQGTAASMFRVGHYKSSSNITMPEGLVPTHQTP